MNEIYWIEEGKLAGRCGPELHPWNLDELYNAGFRSIVSLEVDGIDKEEIKEKGFDHKIIYVEDHTSPTLNQIIEFNQYVGEKIREGKPVLVHCLGGIGRTGTMLASWLIWNGMNPERAIKIIRGKRPHPLTIEPCQERTLYEFSRSLPSIKGEQMNSWERKKDSQT